MQSGTRRVFACDGFRSGSTISLCLQNNQTRRIPGSLARTPKLFAGAIGSIRVTIYRTDRRLPMSALWSLLDDCSWRKATVHAQQHLVVDRHELEMESVGD